MIDKFSVNELEACAKKRDIDQNNEEIQQSPEQIDSFLAMKPKINPNSLPK